MHSTHCWIELDKKALVHNFSFFQGWLGHERLAPVLKSNAYGHGLAEVWSLLAATPPAWIAINYLFEAEALRKVGYNGKLLVVGPLLPDELAAAHSLQADATLGSEEALQAWLQLKQKPYAHLKFDTGMARQGFQPQAAQALAVQLAPHFTRLRGLATHFANVEDVTNEHYAKKQLALLLEAADVFRQRGYQGLIHAASSASSLLLTESRLNLCRIGISLYGLWPSALTRLSFATVFGEVAELKPVLRWKTCITATRQLQTGAYVGYGCTYKASSPLRVGVLSVGYYEGYPRLAGTSGAYVLIHGKRCAILGRICMNMMMVDISHVSTANVGSTVTLIGAEEGEAVTADDLARWSQSINYEVVARLNPIIPRYIDSKPERG